MFIGGALAYIAYLTKSRERHARKANRKEVEAELADVLAKKEQAREEYEDAKAKYNASRTNTD